MNRPVWNQHGLLLLIIKIDGGFSFFVLPGIECHRTSRTRRGSRKRMTWSKAAAHCSPRSGCPRASAPATSRTRATARTRTRPTAGSRTATTCACRTARPSWPSTSCASTRTCCWWLPPCRAVWVTHLGRCPRAWWSATWRPRRSCRHRTGTPARCRTTACRRPRSARPISCGPSTKRYNIT